MTVTQQEIKEILEEAETMADINSLKNEIALTEQDIDSLDMANVYLMIEEKYDIKIADDDIKELSSIDKIVSYLSKK